MCVAPSADIPGRRAAAAPESIVLAVDFGSGLFASLGPDDRGGQALIGSAADQFSFTSSLRALPRLATDVDQLTDANS
jgi:hypothetical protein